ncbi:hypothetical protein DPMN_079951 [Dreissena polymorpha]|uniref:Uncharacterized protein n=1 Tax=Dreissena polymorpha TaxID=45954 RepID=A0A9D3YTJ3_DREPO|nr:hypothetical protein DPMN_079951 [Dreissena polymorpha]
MIIVIIICVLFPLIIIGVILAVYRHTVRNKQSENHKVKGPKTAEQAYSKNHRHGGNVHTHKPQKSVFQASVDRHSFDQYNNMAYVVHAHNRNVPSGYHVYKSDPPPYEVYDPFSGQYVRSIRSTNHWHGSMVGVGNGVPHPSQQRGRMQPKGYHHYSWGRPVYPEYSGNWELYY